jgi:hypothetical protein
MGRYNNNNMFVFEHVLWHNPVLKTTPNGCYRIFVGGKISPEVMIISISRRNQRKKKVFQIKNYTSSQKDKLVRYIKAKKNC